MLKKLLASAGIVALCAATTATAQDIDLSTDFDTFYSFGDSLSDTGNLFAATSGSIPTSPPYFDGRFSNGPVWTELLGLESESFTALGGTNYAFGGAQASGPEALIAPGMFDSDDQINNLFAGSVGTFSPDDLVSVWIGGNNFRPAAATFVGDTSVITDAAIEAATNTADNITSVISLGAENIIVPNLPDLGITPLVIAEMAAPLGSLYSDTFNQALAQQIAGLQAANPGVTITPVDTAGAFDAIIANPAAFGLSNTTTECFDGVTVC
ncbi:MAG: SGNH/GDSL hydrolase family protein, partial [Pseudomonadota bacterium]